MLRELPYLETLPQARPVRAAAAALLRALGAMLDRLALSLVAEERAAAPAGEPVLEFYADAAAPEGALYVNGLLVGKLDGVTRL